MSRDLGRQVLHALQALDVPVAGVQIRDPADRATWQFQLLATATPEQRARAEQFRLSYDPATDHRVAEAEAARVLRQQPGLRALLYLLADVRGVARAKLIEQWSRVYRDLDL